MTAEEPTPTPAEPAEAPAPEVDDETQPAGTASPEAPPSNKRWYVFKATSGREEAVKAAIARRVRSRGGGGGPEEGQEDHQARLREGRQGPHPGGGVRQHGGRGEGDHRAEGGRRHPEGDGRGDDLRPRRPGGPGVLAGGQGVDSPGTAA